MAFSKTIALLEDGETKVFVSAAFTEPDDEPAEFRVTVRRAASGDIEAEAVWHVHETNGAFSLQLTTQTIAIGICLAGCLAGIVSSAGPLVECLKKAKNRSDALKCINKHGYLQVVSAISCIYGCLNL